METLNREDILRMIGLRDSAGLFSKINSLMIDMYDENGKLAEYSTQIVQTEKNITLLAQRVTDDEQDIADLTVTAQQISATVEHQQDEIDEIDGTVSGHTTQIGQLQVTAQEISASVSSLTTTVNGHTSQISTLRTDLNGISATVQSDHTTIGQHTTKIGQLEVTTGNITQTVSSLSDDVDELDGTVSNHTSQISTLRTDLNGISATVQSDHTTLGQHTTKIGQLEVTTGGISQRVTVIEGDYVKNAQISLMVTKNAQGYISNALIDADDIDFVFTDAVSWYWQSQTEANKRMGLDSNGDLWISGQYRGGTITDNVNVGTTGNKMQIYTDETISPQTGYKKSGIRGVNGSTTLLDLGFGDNNYPMMTLRAPTWAGSPQVTHYPGFSRYSYGLYYAEFGMVSSGDGRIHIYAPLQAWPNRNQVTIGAVFVGDDEILRVRLS